MISGISSLLPQLPSIPALDADAEGREVLGREYILASLFSTAGHINKLVFDYAAFASSWKPVLHLPLFPPYFTNIPLEGETCPLSSETFSEIAAACFTATPPRPVFIAQLIENSPQQTSSICKLEEAQKWLKKSFTNPANSSAPIKKVMYFCSFGRPVFEYFGESVGEFDETVNLAKAYALDGSNPEVQQSRKKAMNAFFVLKQARLEPHFLACARIMLHDDPNDKSVIAHLMNFIKLGTPAENNGRIAIIDKIGESNALVQDALGEYFFELKIYDRAQVHYKKALALNPDIANSWARLGFVYYHSNQLQDAKHSFHKAIDIEFFNAFSRSYLGNLLSDLKEYSEAFKHLNAALNLKFREQSVFEGLARLHFIQEDWEKAGEYARELSLDHSFGRLVTAQYCLTQGYNLNAAVNANKAKELMKEESIHTALYYEIVGRVFHNEKKYKKAVEAYDKAEELGQGKRSYIYLYRAEYYFDMLNYQQALIEIEKYFQTHAEANLNNFAFASMYQANLLKGKILMNMRSYSLAIDNLLKSGDLGLALLGEAYFYLDNPLMAERSLELALKHENSIRTKNFLIAVYASIGKLSNTTILCKEVINKDKHAGFAHAYLGKLALDRRELTKARHHLIHARRVLNQNDKFTQMTLHMVLENLKKISPQKTKLMPQTSPAPSETAAAPKV